MYKMILTLTLLIIVGCGKKEESSPTEPIHPVQETASNAYTPRFSAQTKGLKEEKLWDLYKVARADANEQIALGNLNESIDALLLAAECAVALKRHDIAAWQFSNAANSSIQLFKKLTDHDKREAMARDMRRGESKSEYLAETRKIFEQDQNLLTSAMHYLTEAQEHDAQVNRQDEKRKERKEREETIEKNMQFLMSTMSFIKSK